MSYSLSKLLSAIAAAAILSVSAGARAASPATSGERGTWQRHEVKFVYMGFTSIYSCDGLAAKLKLLLKLSGARSDAKVIEGACAAPFGRPDRFASAQLEFYTLAPSEEGDAVPALWRKVRLMSGRPTDIQEGDCELVEQFRDLVLKPAFSTRGMVDQVRCVPHQSNSQIQLEFEVLDASK